MKKPKFVNFSGSTITLEDGTELAPGESIRDGSENPRITELEKAIDVLQGLYDKLEESYKEYKTNTEAKEKAYRDGIDALQEQNRKLTDELSKTTLRAELLMDNLVKYQVFEDALITTFVEPIVSAKLKEALSK